jgi:ATP-dependent DNA helicase RecG
MLRLVQGDVGSGKTLVAAAAALLAIAAGYQVAVMAPTELLAEQHRRNFRGWFAGIVHRPGLAGRQRQGQNGAAPSPAIGERQAQLVIGTHALFQDGVAFARLGLVIVDEQHRFGVHQRLALSPEERRRLAGAPADHDRHADPAHPVHGRLRGPRLLRDRRAAAGTPARGTVLIDNRRRAEVIERVAAACREGRQVYWVCTLIEDSDALQAQAAESTFAELERPCRAYPRGPRSRPHEAHATRTRS